MILIRQAELSDIPWLLEQLQELDQFFGSSRSLFPTIEYAESMLRALITEQPFLVADMDKVGPVGFIGTLLGPHPFNPERIVLNALLVWVQPAHRGSRAFYQLLRAFNRIGEEQAHSTTFTVQPNTCVDPASLTALGYVPRDITYVRERA